MKKLIAALATVALIAIIYSLFSKEEDQGDYIQAVEKARLEKDHFMSKNSDSPFRMFGDTLVKLSYYPIDPQYNLTAQIELIEERNYLTLGSSDGSAVKYLKYAYAHFKLNDQSYRLLILRDLTQSGGLFTAFADETSASETYGAGRYLDLDFKRAKRINLDFNKAYSPYCSYNNTYSCPFPPTENILPVKIEAGEKNYH